MARRKTVWKSANIPVEDYELVKKWIYSGESPYVSVDEACRDAIRNVIYGYWPLKAKPEVMRGKSPRSKPA